MSTQLIVYPQTYQYEEITTTTSSGTAMEFIVDGDIFATLNGASQHEGISDFSYGGHNYITILPPSMPIQPNVWYKYRNCSSHQPPTYQAYPTESGGNVTFTAKETEGVNNGGTNNFSSIYQRLQGLTIGQEYTITIENNFTQSDWFTANVQMYRNNQAFNFFTPNIGINHVYPATGLFCNQPGLPSNHCVLGGSPVQWVFTAIVTDPVFLLNVATWHTTGVKTGAITKISIKNTVTTSSNTTTSILTNGGQEICDLYEDEAIPLTLSIDDFKNVAEKVQSYSKAFKLPGTKHNNRIFDNLFEVTRSAQHTLTFNPYVRTRCELKQDGFLLFEGYLRMIDIQEKDGEISYNVNLYAEVIAFKDTIGDSTFAEMSLTEHEHSYERDSIEDSWDDSTGLPLTNPLQPTSPAFDQALGAFNTNVLKYPFIDWTHSFLLANGSTGTSATANMPELTLLEQAFRPCIQVKYLIDKMFEPTAFTYTSNLFESDDFKKLFVDFNWGENTEGSAPVRNDSTKRESSGTQWMTTNWQRIDLPTAVSGNQTLWDGNDRLVSDVSNLEVSGWALLRLENDAVLTPRDCHMRLVVRNKAGAVVEEIERLDTNLGAGSSLPYLNTSFSTVLNNGEYICLEGYQDSGLPNQVRVNTGSMKSYLEINYNNNAVSAASLLSLARADIKQWDFLKGIFNMFNLVTVPDESDPTNIIIEPYGDIFVSNTNSGNTADLSLASRSITHDWTEKVDITEIKLKPLIDLNRRTIFKFAEDEDDYVFNVYKEANEGHLYGSMIFDASTSSSNLPTLLMGEEEISAEPFGATICKKLEGQFSELITPAIYAHNFEDGTSSSFKNSPRILYNNGVKTMTGTTYYIPAQNGGTAAQATQFLQFSHLTDIPTNISAPPLSTDTRDFHYGVCQLFSGLGQPANNNLFNVYWLPYFGELYNADTRVMTLKLNLTPSDINTLKMYDTIFIKNRVFRINKIDYKPNELATIEFVLTP